MKKITLASLILGLAMPAAFAAGQWDSFHDQQAQERKEYRRTLMDKTPQEREAVLREFRAKQREKKKEFKQAMRRENIDFLRNKLANNPKLNASEKEELKKVREREKAKAAAFWDY